MEKNKVVRFQVKYTTLFAGIFVIMAVTCVLLIVRQYDQYIEQDEAALTKYFHDFNDQINNKFYQIDNRLKQIRASARADLKDSRETGVKFPAGEKLLAENTADNYFHMDTVGKLNDSDFNINITGEGKLTGRDENFKRILRMGLNLYDEFRALKETIPNIMYIYHTSTEKFIVHYPWYSSKDFRFSQSLYDYELWKQSLPKNNPEHKVYWTEAYIDSSGEDGGVMTTCAIPLYDGNKFIGLVGVDLTVDFLNSIVADFEPQRNGGTIIFDNKYNVMAHPASISFKDKSIKNLKDVLPPGLASEEEAILKAPEGVIQQAGQWKYIKSNFHNAPFSMLYYFPKTPPMSNIVSRVGYLTIGSILSMMLLVLSSLYVTNRTLIRPAEKFVNFILNKSEGGQEPPDKDIPGFWNPWFLKIDEIFTENHTLTENIKQSNIILENKNAELEKEIEAKNKAEKEKESLEKQLIQQEKLKAIGLLAGGIAHDFNNQLAVIMGYASVLRSGVKLTDAKQKQCIEQILASATSSAGLTKQLLAFAQKGKYQNIPINIHEMIAEVILILNHTIDKRISIKVDFAAELYTVKGDPAQIQNVIMNIAINARNAMPNGGLITFKTVNQTLTAEQCRDSEAELQPGTFIRISLTDTGTGISEEDKKHIFEPFFTTNNSGHGTGLGLAAALGTIRNHKGDIMVESSWGMGSDFCILLPVMAKNIASSKPVTPHEINVSKSKSKLLLVDDEAAFCRMLTDFMGALGYTIVTCSDPLKAIEYYRNSWQDTDLVIMDMVMPKMNGPDMIREFLKINPATRVVISSGYGAEKDIQELLNNNENIKGFYRKPFDLVKFANEISELLNQQE